MSLRIQVSPRLRGRVPRSIPREVLRRLRRAATRLGVDAERLAGLTVRICDDAEMTKLHGQHMGEAKPTDVMSFPAGAMPEPLDPESDEPAAAPLGDIVIDWDQVRRQATEASERGWMLETTSLAVHGLVHLLGHDHGKRHEARAMLRLERKAARGAGLGPLQRPYGGA